MYEKIVRLKFFHAKNGGRGGSRTLEALSDLHAFQACALGHYATLPWERSLFSGMAL